MVLQEETTQYILSICCLEAPHLSGKSNAKRVKSQSSNQELHPYSLSPNNASFLPAAFVLWLQSTLLLWGLRASRGWCELHKRWHPLQKHVCFFDLQRWHETLHRHKFVFKSGADLIEQEKIVFNISISITVKHLSKSQPLGLYLDCLLPALRLSAESAEIAQLGKVVVIYQCWSNSYWHRRTEEELRVQ